MGLKIVVLLLVGSFLFSGLSAFADDNEDFLILKEYCGCYLTPEYLAEGKDSDRVLANAGTCSADVRAYMKANNVTNLEDRSARNSIYKLSKNPNSSVCSKRSMKNWKRKHRNDDFMKIANEPDDEELEQSVENNECAKLSSIEERRSCRIKAVHKSVAGHELTVDGGSGSAAHIPSLVTNDETTTQDDVSWDALSKAERKKLSRNLVKYCTCASKATDDAQMKCMEYVSANLKVPDGAYGKDVCSKEESKAYAKTLKRSDSNCDRLTTIPERRQCRLAEVNKKTQSQLLTVGGGEGTNVESLITNDETFSGEEKFEDLSKGERKKLEKILKKSCSCERLSDIEQQSDCVKYAMNLDSIPSTELGKKVCSREEVAAYKKTNKNGGDIKLCILDMPESQSECSSNFTTSSKDFKTCTDKITSCNLSTSSKDKCTEKRQNCEKLARSKNKNGPCFQMVDLHNKPEDQLYQSTLTKLCDAGGSLGDANNVNGCYEKFITEPSKFYQCLISVGLDDKYKLGAAAFVCLENAKTKPDATNPIAKDDYFYKRYSGACDLGATEQDQNDIIACYAEARVNTTKAKDLFVACAEAKGLNAKFDLKNFKQALKDEFKVAGCEKYYDGVAAANKPGASPEAADIAQQGLQQCIIKRVGQEAAKAILAEFAKDGIYRLLKDECEKKWKDNEEKKKECLVKLKNTSNYIGAFSSIGMDVMSCIPPRDIRDGGIITDSKKFCEELNADGGGSSKYATPTAKNYCLEKIKLCNSAEYKDKPDLFYACGRTVAQCTKEWVDAGNGTDLNYNETYCENKSIAERMVGNKIDNPDPSFRTSLCVAGAMSSGLKAITAAVCANEKKYPTSEAKEACIKKLQFVNEIGTAGTTVASCMGQGPAPISEEDAAMLSESERGKRDALKAVRNACLAKGLGSQGIEIITQQICNAKKTQEEKEACFKKAGIVKIAGTAAMRIAECKIINQKPYSSDEGDEKAKHDYQHCMQHAVLDSALGFLQSEQAAELACKKHKADKEKFEKCKDNYKAGTKLASVGIHAAQTMVHCGSYVDPKEKQQCLVASSLSVGGELLESLGEVACKKHKGDDAAYEKCMKGYATAGEVVKLAAATNMVINEVAACKGDRACLAAVMAKQLPGDAGVYASFAVQGWGLIRQKNPCKVPSKYLFKASALVKVAGDLTTHIVHKVQADELKKKYADLVHDEKAQGGSDLFSNIKGFVDQQKEDRSKEKAQEEKKFDSQDEANEAQLRALSFQRKNEENTLQSSLWQRPFLYASSTLSAAGNTLGVFEAMAEAVHGKTPATANSAPWKTCEKTGSEANASENFSAAFKSASAKIKEYRHVNLASVNNSFNGLSNQQAFALYEDYERFIDGEVKSLSIEEYDKMGELGLENSPMPLAQSLKVTANYTFNVFPEAEAVDFAVLENIGVNMIGGLFPGSGGFGQASPVGYAQDIVYLFIKKGLDQACGKDKRNAETGQCEYTGKATIEFAAKKAAQALLKEKQKEINKVMNSAAGRIVIGAWNLGKLVKLVSDNEKIIKQQKDRVEYMKGQEEQFKTQMTTADFKFSDKLHDFINNYIIADAWAKANTSPDNLKVCIGKDTNVDFKCNCRKTGCYNIMPLKDKNFRAHVDGMNNQFGKAFGQGLNATNAISNMMDQMFSGARGTEEVNLEQLQQTTEKLGKFNKTLLGAFNNMNTKMTGHKPIDFDAHVANMDKRMFASLHPEVRRQLANVQLASLSPSMEVGNKSATQLEAEKSAIAAEAASEPAEAVEAGPSTVTTEVTSEEQEVQVAKADAEVDDVMNKRYSYDKNDINLDKELSLFKVISGRYHKKKDHLHKHD